jgi:hypothetical protein
MCVLHVSGKNLQFSAVKEGTKLKPYREYHVGEPRLRSKPDGPKWETAGFSVGVSDASWSDLSRQTKDACTFLEQHRLDIEHLKSLGFIDDIRLDFPVRLRIGEKVSAQFDFFPPGLISRAGALGIGLETSIYATGDVRNTRHDRTG